MRGLVLSMVAACSFSSGTPATVGWPSGDPEDYEYWQSYNCFIYDKTFAVDIVATIVGGAITAAGVIKDDRRISLGAGAATTPFLFSAVAGGVGRSRCHRWAREIPLTPVGFVPTAGSGAP